MFTAGSLFNMKKWAISSVCLLLSILFSTYEAKRLDHHVSHYDTVQYDSRDLLRQHYKIRRANVGGPGQQIKLAFSSHGRDFDLRLHPEDSHYLHKDFQLVVDGSTESRSDLLSYSYVGYDANDPEETTVHGNLAFGLFDGAIHTKDEIYHIEPAERYINSSNDEGHHSIAYKHSDVNLSGGQGGHGRGTCGASDERKRRFLARLQSYSTPHPAGSRQKRQNNRDRNKVSCWINVVADHFFYEGVTKSNADKSTRVAQASSLIRNYVAGTSNIFRKEDFDENGSPDNINFAIQKITINTSAPTDNSNFANCYLGVETLLNEFSKADWSDFCLSYIFTNRDFEGGVLGLAFVAKPSQNGGICDNMQGDKTLNTGVVTMVNYNQRISNAAATLTFAHETGHNFGSEHDMGACNPSDNPYIMTAYANDGTRSNNDNFSPCSIDAMDTIIASKGQDRRSGCFRESNDTCGNYLLEEGEDCDCGVDHTNGICNNDPCCNATSCKVVNGKECSPQSSSCCYSNCSVIPMDSNHICSDETECAFQQMCNGSVQCPTPVAKVNTNGSSISCNNGANYCVNGQCTGSICVPLRLPDCECFSDGEACHICCSVEGTCMSTFTLASENATARDLLPGGEGKLVGVGYPCKNFTGYCDFYESCRQVQKSGALARITDFLTGDDVHVAFDWITQYWWAGVVGSIVILVVLFLIVLGCHCLLPRPEHMKKRAQRRRTISMSQGRPYPGRPRRPRHRASPHHSGWIDEPKTHVSSM